MARELDEVLFELVAHGGLIRAAAIDPTTGLEAVVFGPAGAPRGDLERLALAKLRRLAGREPPAPQPSPPRPTKPGHIV
jgi:hypothetical protein